MKALVAYKATLPCTVKDCSRLAFVQGLVYIYELGVILHLISITLL
jgi:hypothetical protein